MSVAPLRQNNAFHSDPKFGRLLLVSLVAHVFIWALLGGDWLGGSKHPKPPVYYVDLVHKPVLNPQAGRPDPRPVKKPKPQPVKQVAAPPVKPVAPKPEVKPAVKPLVKPKPETKPPPKPIAAKPVPRQEQKLQSALEEIRERQEHQAELDAIKDRLAKLRESAAAAAVPANVPVGMPDGQGNEVGVSVLAFVQAFIQQNWVLSPYLLDQSRIANIEAKAALRYDASGKLVSYRVETPSGNPQFDDSLKRAIIKSQQLPQPLPKDLELVVTFNLKEIAAAGR